MATTIYKREIVHHPYRSWTEYYTDKALADKAYEAADPSIGLYVHESNPVRINNVSLYFYWRLPYDSDYNNSPEEIRRKAVGE